MKVAIVGESPADEAGLRLLVDIILGCKTTPYSPSQRTRGWDSVRKSLPVILKSLHYNSDVDGVVVAADSNHTSLSEASGNNRMRHLQAIAGETIRGLASRPGGPTLSVAIAIAMPAIEAWFLAFESADVCEAAWEAGLASGTDPYQKPELKKRLYKVELPTQEVRIAKYQQIVGSAQFDLSILEKRFPNGFGSFVHQLRSWRH